MRVFFYGGTFDPPHIGHKMIVEYCLDKCDKLILIPNKKSPDKLSNPVATYAQRKDMLKLLFNNNKILISDFEHNSDKINYTYLTIKHLKKSYKNSVLTMVIGNDQLVNLKNWKNFEFILNEVKILCFNRLLPDDDKSENKLIKDIKFIEKFNINISSSIVRKNILNNSIENLSGMLNNKIIKYIIEERLYV